MTQAFKGDEIETKISGAAADVFRRLSEDLQAWLGGAYKGEGLGALLYDNRLTDIAGKISRQVFIDNYGAILEQWEYPGTLESYLYVLRSVFGPDVQVTFTPLAPGALGIEVRAYKNKTLRWLGRVEEIWRRMSTDVGVGICFVTPVTILGAAQVMAVLETLIPAGIYVELNLKLTD